MTKKELVEFCENNECKDCIIFQKDLDFRTEEEKKLLHIPCCENLFRLEENKELVKEFPFLKPRNVWTDEEIEDYDYSFTILDEIPEGWKKSFGRLLCEDIKKVLIKENTLDSFRIDQIKEKYGTLRLYCNGSKEIQDIINKYEHISKHTCIVCGNVNVPIYDDGWVSPYCDKCFEKSFNKRKTKSMKKPEDFKVCDALLTPTFKMTTFSKEGTFDEEFSCFDILKRMNVDISSLITFEELEKKHKNKKD